MKASTRVTANPRRGAVTAWLVLCLGVIVGIVAIGMDGGRMMEQRRRAQTVADAAALAGAAALYENHPASNGLDLSGVIGSILRNLGLLTGLWEIPLDQQETARADKARAAALQNAASNGYANDGKTSEVTINIPPKSGEFAGKADYIEVIAKYHLPGTFGAAITQKELTVQARSVARGRPAKIGIIALRPTGAGTFLNNSKGTIAVLNSSIYVNSDDSAALKHNGLLPLIADSFDITGNYVNAGVMLGKIRTGTTPIADPLRDVPAPQPADYVTRSNKTLNLNFILPVVLQPGVYEGGIKISGLAIVIMQPGVYIMAGGGLQVTGGTVVGLGVTIYNSSGPVAAGPINVSGLGRVILTAPLQGTYQGISIFQDRTVAQPISVTGLGTTLMTGAIYAPAAPLSLTGTVAAGLDLLGGAYICDTITIGGLGSVNVGLGINRPRVPDIGLVE